MYFLPALIFRRLNVLSFGFLRRFSVVRVRPPVVLFKIEPLLIDNLRPLKTWTVTAMVFNQILQLTLHLVKLLLIRNRRDFLLNAVVPEIDVL